MRILCALIVLALAAGALSACNTVEGFGQDMSSAGHAIQRAGQ
jgi:predicted small secreted protein